MAISTAEKLKNKIEYDILMLKLKPGERLDETKLAERFGASRTPVREALRQLAASGLVEIRPHRGAAVARLSIPQLVEMFEYMGVLEGVCCRFAAKRATMEELQAIRAVHEESRPLAETGEYNDYYRFNSKFHDGIYKASHNSTLAEETLWLRNRLAPYRLFQLKRVNRPKHSFAEHEQILAAIENGNAARAEELMQDHISIGGTFITSLIASLPPEFLAESAELTPLLKPGMRAGSSFMVPAGFGVKPDTLAG